MRGKEMSAARRPVGHADDDMRVDMWCAVFQRDIADQGQNFNLLVDLNLSIVLSLSVEIAEGRVAESADGGEMAAADTLLFREIGQSRRKFIPFIKYQGECFLLALSQISEFHE